MQSEKREESLGTKRLYRVWSSVDSKIELPASLSAHALLPKLDTIEQPVSPIGRIRFSPKIFTWQSGVTYAAAFALILMLSSVLTRGDQPAEMLRGEIASAPAIAQEEAAVTARAMPDAVTEDTVPVAEEPAVAADQDVSAFASRMLVEPEPAESAGEALGIGGQSESILLGTDDTYTYLWRVNDPTDPDKEGYPVTVNIVDTKSGELAAVIDLPDMLAVEGYYLYNDIVAFAGSGENSAVLYAFDIADMENPTPYLNLSQQGAFADSGLYNNTLHLLTVVETSGGLDCEVIPLPGSKSGGACCVVTAVDLATKEAASKAFSGVGGGDIYLYNLHAYMSYNGEVTEENQTGNYLAQIRLDGMNIELTSGPEQEEETAPEQPAPEEPLPAGPEQPAE